MVAYGHINCKRNPHVFDNASVDGLMKMGMGKGILVTWLPQSTQMGQKSQSHFVTNKRKNIIRI